MSLSLSRKKALVEATLDESYKDLLKSTRVLVFFGTPHQGGRNATVGDYAADLYRAMTFKPRNDLVDALKADSDSASKRFEQFRHKHEDFQVISCFEGRPYSKAAGIVSLDLNHVEIRCLTAWIDCRQTFRYFEPAWKA